MISILTYCSKQLVQGIMKLGFKHPQLGIMQILYSTFQPFFFFFSPNDQLCLQWKICVIFTDSLFWFNSGALFFHSPLMYYSAGPGSIFLLNSTYLECSLQVFLNPSIFQDSINSLECFFLESNCFVCFVIWGAVKGKKYGQGKRK